jgi:hypothetical protein
MALTKVGGGLLQSPLSVGVVTATTFNGNVNAGVITATSGIQAIGIYSGGTAIHSGVITALNFVGTGNTFLVHNNTIDISISGGGGGASVVYDNTVFAYDNIIDTDITISQPYKTAAIYTDLDVTADIESGAQLSVDDGCILNIVDL